MNYLCSAAFSNCSDRNIHSSEMIGKANTKTIGSSSSNDCAASFTTSSCRKGTPHKRSEIAFTVMGQGTKHNRKEEGFVKRASSDPSKLIRRISRSPINVLSPITTLPPGQPLALPPRLVLDHNNNKRRSTSPPFDTDTLSSHDMKRVRKYSTDSSVFSACSVMDSCPRLIQAYSAIPNKVGNKCSSLLKEPGHVARSTNQRNIPDQDLQLFLEATSTLSCPGILVQNRFASSGRPMPVKPNIFG